MARLVLPEPAGTDQGGGVDWTPLRFVVDSGLRPIVMAVVDGAQVEMLVHANAGFVVMLTHAARLRIAGDTVAKEQDFGLGHDLELSEAGRGHATVGTLTVAGRTIRDVRVEVFDLPTRNWEGMLGVEWLAAAGAVVDFGASRLGVPRGTPDRTSEPAAGGGVSVPLIRERTGGRFVANLAPDGADRPSEAFVVSTVAETTIDIACAVRLGLDLGEPVEVEHGPRGDVVPVYRPSVPVAFGFAGRRLFACRVSVYDIYAYGGKPRPADGPPLAGYLGADVLTEHGAVVDFGEAGSDGVASGGFVSL